MFGIYTLCTNVASLVGHILLCSLYIQHYTCDNTDCILYKILKDLPHSHYLSLFLGHGRESLQPSSLETLKLHLSDSIPLNPKDAPI